MHNKPLYDNIDKEIVKGKNNYVIDNRINKVNYDKFFNESYELFRLELSNYLNKNSEIRDKIHNIVNTTKTISNEEKINKIKLVLYRLIDKDLYRKYKLLSNVDDDIELSEDYDISMSENTESMSESDSMSDSTQMGGANTSKKL